MSSRPTKALLTDLPLSQRDNRDEFNLSLSQGDNNRDEFKTYKAPLTDLSLSQETTEMSSTCSCLRETTTEMSSRPTKALLTDLQTTEMISTCPCSRETTTEMS